MKFVIVAGGQGTKVWPFSRKDKPKQFQKILGDTSLFTYNVKTLLKKRLNAGHHEVIFNAQSLSSGIYFYRIQAGTFQDVKKMILIR